MPPELRLVSFREGTGATLEQAMDTPVIISNGNVRVKPCRHGLFAYFINDFYVGRSLDYYGEYSEEEILVFNQLVKPGMFVVEVGANIGSHTVSLARAVGPTGQVFAFEPQRPIFHLLCTNIALNNLMNVTTFQSAVGNAAGTIVVPSLDYQTVTNFGGVELGKVPEGTSVPIVTLDSLNLPICHFLKIDVEGMELDVVEGAISTIHRFRPLMYIENDRPNKSVALLRMIFSLNYRVYWHTPVLYNQDNFFANSNNVFDDIISINVLCIPSEITSSINNFVEIRSIDEAIWTPYNYEHSRNLLL